MRCSMAKNATPVVTLDTDGISQEMAARLTIALLGQILYMKGQVPFPIGSLSRMGRKATENASRASIRAEKRRLEFMDSYDDLTSHLHTTFVALSTALAKNEKAHPVCSAPTSTPSTFTKQKTRDTSPKTGRLPAKIHILLILGPSPSTAKARYLLEFDGFHVEQFGEREYKYRDDSLAERDHYSSENEDEPVASSSSSETSHATTPPRESPGYADKWQTPSSSSSKGSYDSESVPSSPSATSSVSHSDSGDEGSAECRLELEEEANSLVFPQSVEEASLRAGERLLFRALFAGDDDLGFGDEISPTQVHVLIRAPRRFTHPTWIPRQSLGGMLDRQVQYFLESESVVSGTKSTRQRNNAGFGVGLRTVGVRVTCRGNGDESLTAKLSGSVDSSDVNAQAVGYEMENVSEEEHGTEDDELIWWSWDGKLVGFSD